MKTCAQCGLPTPETVGRGPARIYCSSACNLAARGRRVTVHNSSGYSHGCRCDVCKTANSERMRSYFRERGGNPYRKPTEKHPCQGGCGKPIRGGTCADCTPVIRARLARRRRAIAALARASQGTSGTRAWVYGPCADCSEVFTRLSTASQFCSKRCARRVRNGNRRALEAGCKITPGRRHAVHERDNWMCRLCGFPVNREAAVPDLEAPVIDHVVSLARGGDHAPHNWQTAHFICNSYKRDLDMTEVA